MNIKIIEKDDTVSYDSLLSVIHKSFEERLKQGLYYTCSSYTKEDLINRTKDGKLLIAIDEETNNILGVSGYTIKRKRKIKYGYFAFIGIDENAKKTGVGSLLFQEVLKYNILSGSEYIESNTAKQAESAVKFHLKNGFRIVGLNSFMTTNYYSYVFRYQIKKPSIWNNARICKLSYIISYCITKTLKKETDYTLLGKIGKKIQKVIL